MPLNLSADELLTTTRAVRKRLDFDRPVEREVVMECLEIALQAPSGSNRQGWQFLFVDDPAKKQALQDIYLPNLLSYRGVPKPQYADGDPRRERQPKVADSSGYLAENIHRVPLLLVPCLQGRVQPGDSGAGFWGSILPAVWSFQLALRERGLGSAWTTLHLPNDGERRAAEILGIPYDEYSQAGLFPIAYTIGTEFKRASRLPAEQLVHWNAW